MSTPRPKKKAMRNEPLFYDEAKVRKAIWLTPSTWNTLKQVAESEGVSISELVERWGRHLNQLSVISYQLSVISYQLSVNTAYGVA